MSLSTRAIAGIAGVVVVGAASLGTGIYWAHDAGKPRENVATMVVGTSTTTAAPFCYNDGKPLDSDYINACAERAQKASEAKQLPTLDVRSSDRIGVGVPKELADKGWYAMTDGGSSSGSRASIISNAKGVTYSGSKSAAGLMSAGDITSVTVVSQDPASKDLYAVWFFDLKNQAS
ncbi:DUF2771 family protein [Kitasatospora phosalacinea]|uniref:DUF2771 family protein n=1 Tax=Kitasatospora phosalacinea TaxID=2065 RepID=UPI000525D3F2|nr:DUF2771 family protein [Kitasatospora phosalacinea]